MEHNPQNRFTISSEYEIPADAIFDLGGQQISVQFGVNIATQLDVELDDKLLPKSTTNKNLGHNFLRQKYLAILFYVKQ